MTMLSKRQVALENLKALETWIAMHDAASDWDSYIRAGRLNRSEISRECGFARSVLLQNPAVKAGVEALEARLRVSGVLPSLEGEDAEPEPADSPRDADRRRIERLEARVAELVAENRDLRARLRHSEVILREAVPEGKRIDSGRFSVSELDL